MWQGKMKIFLFCAAEEWVRRPQWEMKVRLTRMK
jgi:hypothetical protein